MTEPSARDREAARSIFRSDQSDGFVWNARLCKEIAAALAAARAEGATEMRERCELIALRSRDELQPCTTSYRGVGPEWNMANEIATKIRSLK